MWMYGNTNSGLDDVCNISSRSPLAQKEPLAWATRCECTSLCETPLSFTHHPVVIWSAGPRWLTIAETHLMWRCWMVSVGNTLILVLICCTCSPIQTNNHWSKHLCTLHRLQCRARDSRNRGRQRAAWNTRKEGQGSWSERRCYLSYQRINCAFIHKGNVRKWRQYPAPFIFTSQ